MSTWIRTSALPQRSAYRAIDQLLERAMVQHVGRRYALTAACSPPDFNAPARTIRPS